VRLELPEEAEVSGSATNAAGARAAG